MMLTWLGTLLLVNLTSMGFPYTANVAPQRLLVLHTKRTFMDSNGNVTLRLERNPLIRQSREIEIGWLFSAAKVVS